MFVSVGEGKGGGLLSQQLFAILIFKSQKALICKNTLHIVFYSEARVVYILWCLIFTLWLKNVNVPCGWAVLSPTIAKRVPDFSRTIYQRHFWVVIRIRSPWLLKMSSTLYCYSDCVKYTRSQSATVIPKSTLTAKSLSLLPTPWLNKNKKQYSSMTEIWQFKHST